MNMTNKLRNPLWILMIIISLVFASSSFAGQTEDEKEKARCEKLIEQLDHDLKMAKADIIADAGPISHATTLLAGATIAYQFGRFKGCIDKATRGRARIAKLLKDSGKKD